MKVNYFTTARKISMVILCIIALCLQGCPINQLQNNYSKGVPNRIWIYSPADSVSVTMYTCENLITKKYRYCYTPDSCFAMYYLWHSPEDTVSGIYDEYDYGLHLRKMSNIDTTYVITGSSWFYLNSMKCYYGLWIIPQYLYTEPDSLRTTYSFKQILDSLRVHYPNLVTPITDTEKHVIRLNPVFFDTGESQPMPSIKQ